MAKVVGPYLGAFLLCKVFFGVSGALKANNYVAFQNGSAHKSYDLIKSIYRHSSATNAENMMTDYGSVKGGGAPYRYGSVQGGAAPLGSSSVLGQGALYSQRGPATHYSHATQSGSVSNIYEQVKLIPTFQGSYAPSVNKQDTIQFGSVQGENFSSVVKLPLGDITQTGSTQGSIASVSRGTTHLGYGSAYRGIRKGSVVSVLHRSANPGHGAVYRRSGLHGSNTAQSGTTTRPWINHFGSVLRRPPDSSDSRAVTPARGYLGFATVGSFISGSHVVRPATRYSGSTPGESTSTSYGTGSLLTQRIPYSNGYSSVKSTKRYLSSPQSGGDPSISRKADVSRYGKSKVAGKYRMDSSPGVSSATKYGSGPVCHERDPSTFGSSAVKTTSTYIGSAQSGSTDNGYNPHILMYGQSRLTGGHGLS